MSIFRKDSFIRFIERLNDANSYNNTNDLRARSLDETYFRSQGLPTTVTNSFDSSPGTNIPVRLKSLKKGEKYGAAVESFEEAHTVIPSLSFASTSFVEQHLATTGSRLYSSGTKKVEFC